MPAPAAETLIDRVNGKDRPIGLVARRAVFEQQANFRVVHVLLFDAEDALLLQRLGATRERHPLQWGSSIAGYLHAGESYDEAAARRTLEELGIQPGLRPVGRTSMIDAGSKKFIGVYTGVIDRSSPWVRDPEHIQEIAFVPLHEVRDRLTQDPETFTATFRHVLRFWEVGHSSPDRS